ncbi:MAG TPA: FGGY-family carbohydrate kinase [Solirubrobacteraceae bacterium]|nr:FGGY-family carbohydrate kinase [Solirubrobacteraceae bacterium]
MTYVIGVDSSTTATKAVVWDREGRSVAEGRAEFGLALPRPGWHEQDAKDWWRSTCAAIRQALETVDASEVEAIGLTHQRETFACLGDNDRPLRPAILWMDSRATQQVAEHGSEDVHRITGKPPDTTPALYKLLWLRDHEPETLERTRRVVDVHGFLVHRLTGRWRTTTACADPLGLVDMEKGDWAAPILELAGLDREQLPELDAPGSVMGELSEDAAASLGLEAGLPIVGGAGDGQSAGLGANVTGPGRAYLNLGTAVVAGTSSPEYVWDRAFRTMGGPIPGTYSLEALIQGGTYTVSWFLDRIASLDAERLSLGLEDVDLLEAAATRVAPGAEGLLLVPYWAGSQAPYWDSHAHGILFGLGGHHGKEHLFRAVLEGIAFELRVQLERLEQSDVEPVEVFLTMGGGSRSALWRQIVSDITRRRVIPCREVETTNLGAGMHAAAAIGWFDSIADAAEAMAQQGASHEPDEATAGRYDALFEVYRELYPRTAELHRALDDAREA